MIAWRGNGRLEAPALAVPCPSCAATIGRWCAQVPPRSVHDARACVAEAVGFVVVADAPLFGDGA